MLISIAYAGDYMWLDELVREHLVIKEALNVLLLAGGSSYIIGRGEVIEDILPLYKEFKNIFIDSCHHRKEEMLVERISSAGYKPGFDVEGEHSVLRERFKDVMSKYVSGDRGFELASAIAGYYEAMKRHIDDEESKLFKELLVLIPRVGVRDEEVEEMLKRVEKDLGEGVHDKMEKLVKEMEEIIERDLGRAGSVALNVIDIAPYKRHVLIKEVISKMKGERRTELILINDHEPIPLFYELLNTEKCFDSDRFTTNKLSETVWIALIPLKPKCT